MTVGAVARVADDDDDDDDDEVDAATAPQGRSGVRRALADGAMTLSSAIALTVENEF